MSLALARPLLPFPVLAEDLGERWSVEAANRLTWYPAHTRSGGGDDDDDEPDTEPDPKRKG